MRLWFAHEDGIVWLRADERRSDWYRNLIRARECTIEVGGQTLRGTYEPVADRNDALRHLVTLWRAKYGNEWVSDWYVDSGRMPVTIRIAPA